MRAFSSVIELLVWGKRSNAYRRLRYRFMPYHEREFAMTNRNWNRMQDELFSHLPPREARRVMAVMHHYRRFAREI